MTRLIFLTALSVFFLTEISATAGNFPFSAKSGFQDTIIIKLPNGSGITIFVKDTKQLKSFSKYKLDSLLQMLGTYVENIEKMETSNNGKETKEISVTFNPGKDSKDPHAPQQITVTLSAKNLQKTKKESQEDLVKIKVDYEKEYAPDSINKIRKTEKKADKRIHERTFLDLGWNSLVGAPSNSGDKYDIRPLGSRYVALGVYKTGKIGGKSSPLHIRGGLGGTFNNFMFDKNHYIVDMNGVTDLLKEPETGRSFEKSKLTYSSINVPIDVYLRFKDKRGRNTFSVSAGGFAGYRLGAHSKVKYQEKNNTFKDKERGSYNLEDFLYGTTFSIGYRGLELFGNYNLNTLFKENRGPEMQTVSFGFRL